MARDITTRRRNRGDEPPGTRDARVLAKELGQERPRRVRRTDQIAEPDPYVGKAVSNDTSAAGRAHVANRLQSDCHGRYQDNWRHFFFVAHMEEWLSRGRG